MASFSIKRAVQTFLRGQHLELRKAPFGNWAPLPIFDLAVERVMHLRGDSLRFIQVGANDGVFGDPLRKYVTTRGWRGILCEPQDDVFAALQRNYAFAADRLIFEKVAVSRSSEPLTLYRAPDIGLSAGSEMPHALTVTSSSARVVARQTGVAEHDLVKIVTPAITLDALVERHGFAGFDLLQIDVEGFDFEVLSSLSLDRHRPAVIQFEHGHLKPYVLTEASRFLSKHGYLLHYGGHSTDSVAMPQELFEAT